MRWFQGDGFDRADSRHYYGAIVTCNFPRKTGFFLTAEIAKSLKQRT